MFGNKFAGDNIAREFLRIMGEEKFSSFKKESSESSESDSAKLKAEASVKPEDFLVTPEEDAAVSSAIDNKISEMEAKIDDCDKCGKAMDSCACDGSMADDQSMAMDYMVDEASQEVFEGLGKIAASLRAKNEGFAADVVTATALSIRDDLVKEASKKAFVLDSLKKMASNLRKEDDYLAADMVEATIQKIKAK